jgi:hypothetical protein
MINRHTLSQWIISTILSIAFLLCSFPKANAAEVAALVTKETTQATQLFNALQAGNIDIRKVTINRTDLSFKLDGAILQAQSLLIIGKEAFEYYLENQLDIPVLVLFVKSSTFYHLTRAESHVALVENRPTHFERISAVFSDPSPYEQMALIKRHFPYPSVSVLLSPLNYYLEEELNQSAMELGLRLNVLKVNKEVDINRALNTLPAKHALLALPDQYIYNSMTLKNIIISTYRSGKPIFGFSRAMVKAGAVASVVTDTEQLAAETLRFLATLREELPKRKHSQLGKIVVNDAVARSLNLISLQQENESTL